MFQILMYLCPGQVGTLTFYYYRLDQKQAVSNYEECKALLETKTRQLKDTEKRSVGAATAITNIEAYATRQVQSRTTKQWAH